MDPRVLTDFATFLKDTGPYGIIIFMGLALWRLWVAKEKNGDDFLKAMVETTKESTDAMRTAAERLAALERTTSDRLNNLERHS